MNNSQYDINNVIVELQNLINDTVNPLIELFNEVPIPQEISEDLP